MNATTFICRIRFVRHNRQGWFDHGFTLIIGRVRSWITVWKIHYNLQMRVAKKHRIETKAYISIIMSIRTCNLRTKKQNKIKEINLQDFLSVIVWGDLGWQRRERDLVKYNYGFAAIDITKNSDTYWTRKVFSTDFFRFLFGINNNLRLYLGVSSLQKKNKSVTLAFYCSFFAVWRKTCEQSNNKLNWINSIVICGMQIKTAHKMMDAINYRMIR